MQVLTGSVSKLRCSTEVSGSGERVSSQQVASFLLNNKPVRLQLRQAPHLDDGDTVSVCGRFKKGVLECGAYLNHSNGASGSTHWLEISIGLVLGLAMTLISGAFVVAGILRGLRGDTESFGWAAFTAIFLCWGVVWVRAGWHALQMNSGIENLPRRV